MSNDTTTPKSLAIMRIMESISDPEATTHKTQSTDSSDSISQDLSQLEDEATNQNLPKERAKRLKSLREMTGLSRESFKKRYDIPRGTIQNWETARFGGLTTKGAHLIIRAMNAEGIQCNIGWLLYGVGPTPSYMSNPDNSILFNLEGTNGTSKEHTNVTKELLTLKNQNQDTIDFVINDDSMAPQFQKGDYVAGIRQFKEHIQHLVGQLCIIQTPEHGTLFRKLKKSSNGSLNTFNLLSLNPETSVSEPCLYNCEVITAAPVLWHRRPEKILQNMINQHKEEIV